MDLVYFTERLVSNNREKFQIYTDFKLKFQFYTPFF
jgi:hypothetical protein